MEAGCRGCLRTYLSHYRGILSIKTAPNRTDFKKTLRATNIELRRFYFCLVTCLMESHTWTELLSSMAGHDNMKQKGSHNGWASDYPMSEMRIGKE